MKKRRVTIDNAKENPRDKRRTTAGTDEEGSRVPRPGLESVVPHIAQMQGDPNMVQELTRRLLPRARSAVGVRQPPGGRSNR